jgi:hypothetical protein
MSCGPAVALTWEYRLAGSEVTSCTPSSPETAHLCDLYLGQSFDGSIFINERLLSGGTLRNQSLTWEIRNVIGTGQYAGDFLYFGENIEALDFRLPISLGWYFDFYYPNVFSVFSMGTDQSRQVTGWSLQFINDAGDLWVNWGYYGFEGHFPEDGWSSKGMVLYGESGQLSRYRPSPIPLPAAGWLLLAGLAGIAAAGRRRCA